MIGDPGQETQGMTMIERNGDDFVVPASLLGEAFGLAEAEIRERMRDGTLTSRCETGQDEDEGRWRLSFRHKGHVVRLTVDASGRILSRARFAAPLPQDAND